MQHRLPRLVGSLGFLLVTTFLVALLPFASPITVSAFGPGGAGNGGAVSYGKSLTRPAVGASFSSDAIGGNSPVAMTQIGHTLMVTNTNFLGSISVYEVSLSKLKIKTTIPLPVFGSPSGIGGF